jgi:hypothetical protein
MVGAQEHGGGAEILLVADVVAVEHRARFVAGHFHRDTFTHPGAYEVADRSAPEIVDQPAGHAGRGAGLSPHAIERFDGCPAPVEDERAGLVCRCLERVGGGPLRLEQLADLCRHDEDARLPAFRAAGGDRSGHGSREARQSLPVQKAQSANVLSCGLYLHPHGIEARCGYGNEEDLLMSQVERTPDAARARADEWKQTALARGFEEIR